MIQNAGLQVRPLYAEEVLSHWRVFVVCHAMKDISSILWSKAQDGIILLSLAHDGFKPRHADIPCYLLTPVLFLCV